jgi:hypothetical protein
VVLRKMRRMRIVGITGALFLVPSAIALDRLAARGDLGLTPELAAAAREVNARALEGLTAADAEQLMDSIDAVIANLASALMSRDRRSTSVIGPPE